MEQSCQVFTFLFSFLNFGFLSKDDFFTPLSEDLLDAWYHIRDLDDPLHENVDVAEKLLVRWIMDDVPICLVLWVKHREYLENGNQLLTQWVAYDALVKVKQCDLHRVLQRFQKTIVQSVNELEPLVLDSAPAPDEQLVRLHDEHDDLVKRLLQINSSQFQDFILLRYEGLQLVNGLLDVGDASAGDPLEFIFDLLLVVLENLHVVLNCQAFSAALVDEVID